MAVNAVTDLEDHIFCFLKQRDRKIILYNSLTFSLTAILGQKKYPSHVIALIHLMYHFSYNFEHKE